MAADDASPRARVEPVLDWVVGDALGLPVPARPAVLAGAGADYLTRAFHAAGSLAPDNAVTQVTDVRPCPGGSTGAKLLLSLAYARAEDAPPAELFAKFSRDFDDPIRDRGRDQLQAEVRLGRLSADPAFPVRAPSYLFGDYEAASGTGLLITGRIPFGQGGVEPQHDKCCDWRLDDPLPHYRALVCALAELAGTHKAGRLASADALFPFDRAAALAGDPIRYDARQIANRVARLRDFAASYPRLLPPEVRQPAFLDGLTDQLVRYAGREAELKAYLHDDGDYIALCHWNGNIDNAWFERDADGALTCGLLDWGRVGQMSLAMALWGALAAAEPVLWRRDLDSLLQLFTTRYAQAGGPAIDPGELKRRLLLTAALMGIAWLLDAPPLIRSAVPDLDRVESRQDARISDHEMPRTQLHMLTTFLTTLTLADLSRAA